MKNQLFSKILSAILIVMLTLVALPVTPARAATLTVTTNADAVAVNGQCSLREAIVNANNDAATNADCAAGTGNDIIVFSAAVTTITLGSALPAVNDGAGANDLAINGGSTVTIDANGVARIFNVTNGAFTVQNITLSNGQVDGNGGAILYNDDEGLVVSSVTFNTNRTVNGGGNDGGAIYHNDGPLSISNSIFIGNYTQDNGGAIFINDGTGTMTITGTSFTNQNNTAIDDGGAIYLDDGNLTINGGSFTGNIASGDGGAIFVGGGTLTIGNTTGVTFTSNSAIDGGAIFHDTDTLLSISNSTFTTNSATNGDGGAIVFGEADASGAISNSTFTGNTATDDGGAIFNLSDPLTITGSTFANNSTTSASGGGPGAADGGAIYNDGEADGTTIRLSTFTGNSTTHTNNNASRGGAIYNDGSGFVLANVTFSGNSANETNAGGGGNAQGGAVWTNATTTIHNVTFSGNTAVEAGSGTSSGGNLFRNGGTVTVANSILNSGTPNNCGGTITNGGNNIDSGATCGWGALLGSVSNTNPNLGALIGSPAYFPLNTGSSAINTGSNAICATATTTNNQSQNGLTRPQGTNCEIGSYEFPPNTTPTGTDNTITINEDSTHIFAAANFGFNDADAGDSMSAVRIDTLTLPAGATLQLSAVNVTAGQVILTANIPNLIFTPAANANGTGYASFTFSVRDTNGPIFDTTPNTMTFDVTAINDVPSFTASNPVAVNEDTGAQSVPSWATFSAGPANESGQTVSQYIISGSTCGTLLSAGPAVDTTGQLTYTPATNENGTCTFNVAVQDNGGGTDTSPTQNFTITVNAVNDEPSFTATDPAAVNEDAGLQTVLGWVTAFNPGPANESGQTVSAYNVTIGTCGTLLTGTPSVNTSGDLSYTPAANQNGTCIFNVAVQDNGGTANGGDDTSPTQNFTITVNAVDDASTANDDTATVTEDDSAITINVRGNDTDIDSAVENIASVTQPTNGTVVITNAGADLTYQPDANYCDNGTPTDDFTYTLTNGSTADVSVTVTCVDDASTANDDTATVAEDASATTINVRGNDTDIDSAVENITSVTQPTNGTVVITNGGLDLTYQPDANYCNNGTPTDDFTYTLTNGSTANVSVTVTCVNDASTANDDTASIWEDSGVNTINVRTNDTDIDSAVENITSVTQPSNGTVVITNGGADLTYQPDAEYCNNGTPTDDFTYTLTGGDSATVQVTVTCQTAITANITANDKVYNGDNLATFTCSLTGVVPPDVVTCTGGSATFTDKNVGTGKLVTATGLGITGADAFKYELTSTSATDNADITQHDLNVTATGINKVYDGNTNASVTLNDDRVGGDILTVDYTSASFADPNVANGILVTVNGINISGGADAGNYNLVNTSTTTNANITPASQTINVTTSAPANAVNGSTFDVVATATSGLPVTITTAGSCSGGDTDGDATITMTSGTGTCNVFYNQAGNTNYSAALQVQEDVIATDSPVFTSADNTTFDFGFSDTFAITATGNPSTMSITMTGEPTGITLTDNGDGTATLNYDGTTTPGVYTITFTADNGVAPNGIQTFTLTIRNGPTVAMVNSVPDTGNGSVSENESILNTLNITQLIVVFSRDVYDPAGDTDPDDVTNPANYVLVRSATGSFATSTCAGGVTAPDVSIAVDTVTYDNITFTATLNVNGGLPLNVNGFYRLFVCGTTSIVDATNPLLNLAGNGVTPGTDFTRTFRITAPAATGGGGGNNSGSGTSTNLSGVLIPVTGFTPNQVTKLPAQSIGNAYTASKLRIEIPSLSMDLPIVGIALKDKQFDVTWLGSNAGYLEGSAYPTWQGNSILTGHVTDANGKPGPFAYVNELSTGDQIYIHNNGFIYVYEVRESKLVLPNKITDLFKHEEDYWLTLVTCENFDAKSETFTHRRIIRAVLISILPAK